MGTDRELDDLEGMEHQDAVQYTARYPDAGRSYVLLLSVYECPGHGSAGSRSSSPMPLPRTPLPCQALDWPGLARRPLLLHTVMRSAVAGSGTGGPIHPIRCFLPDRALTSAPPASARAAVHLSLPVSVLSK